MLVFIIWLGEFIEKLHMLLGDIIFFCVATLVVYGISKVVAELLFVGETNKPHILLGGKFIKRMVFILLPIAVALQTIVPSQRTYYIMLGAYVGQEIVETVVKSPITQKSLKLLESKLDEFIADDTKPASVVNMIIKGQ